MKRPIFAVVLTAGLAMATVVAPTQAQARWGGWGWGLGGFALGALAGAAIASSAYADPGYYGYGYPAYGYGYGYPAYGYGYPAYSYGYAYPGYATASYAYAPTYYRLRGMAVIGLTFAVPGPIVAIAWADALQFTELAGAEGRAASVTSIEAMRRWGKR